MKFVGGQKGHKNCVEIEWFSVVSLEMAENDKSARPPQPNHYFGVELYAPSLPLNIN